MGYWFDQLKLVVLSIGAVMALAIGGLSLTVTPSYELVTRPTPTPSPAPYSWFNDPRLTQRTVTVAQAEAAAGFRVLRPAMGVAGEPQPVTLDEGSGRVVRVRQTYRLAGSSISTVEIWQAPDPAAFTRGIGGQSLANTIVMTMPDGRQQPATLARMRSGLSLSWTDANGWFMIRTAEGVPFERLAEIAASLR